MCAAHGGLAGSEAERPHLGAWKSLTPPIPRQSHRRSPASKSAVTPPASRLLAGNRRRRGITGVSDFRDLRRFTASDGNRQCSRLPARNGNRESPHQGTPRYAAPRPPGTRPRHFQRGRAEEARGRSGDGRGGGERRAVGRRREDGRDRRRGIVASGHGRRGGPAAPDGRASPGSCGGRMGVPTRARAQRPRARLVVERAARQPVSRASRRARAKAFALQQQQRRRCCLWRPARRFAAVCCDSRLPA